MKYNEIVIICSTMRQEIEVNGWTYPPFNDEITVQI